MGLHTDCLCRWLALTKIRFISIVLWRVINLIALHTIDREEKITALRAICQRFLPHHMDAFDDAIARSLDRTAVVRITLTEPPVGKRKQYDKDGEEMKWGRME